MTKGLTFRAGRPEDASDLALLLDAASRRKCSWYWSTLAAPGQSWFEVGRDRVHNQPDATSHHSKWHVAEAEGRIALEVESPNTGAISLYRKCGFTEWERRVFVPFPGSDDEGDWILVVRDL